MLNADDLETIKNSAKTIRDQAAEIVELKTKIASFERRDHADRIAAEAAERGLLGELDQEEYADQLTKQAADLTALENLIRAAPAGIPLGKVKEASANGSASGTSSEDAFNSALLSL